jgi:glycine cleavage system H lipoate-binding protein
LTGNFHNFLDAFSVSQGAMGDILTLAKPNKGTHFSQKHIVSFESIRRAERVYRI